MRDRQTHTLTHRNNSHPFRGRNNNDITKYDEVSRHAIYCVPSVSKKERLLFQQHVAALSDSSLPKICDDSHMGPQLWCVD